MFRARVFEELKEMGNSSLRRIAGTRVGSCREALADESSSKAAGLAAEREALIAELRGHLTRLAEAFRSTPFRYPAAV